MKKYIRLIGHEPGYPEDGMEYHFAVTEEGMREAKEMYEKNKKTFNCKVEIVQEVEIEHDDPWGVHCE